jgi:hypothetical protein
MDDEDCIVCRERVEQIEFLGRGRSVRRDNLMCLQAWVTYLQLTIRDRDLVKHLQAHQGNHLHTHRATA